MTAITADDRFLAEFERLPPHDLRAERCTLGGMLLSNSMIGEVADVMAPDEHSLPAHQVIHAAILALDERGEPTDAVAVAAALVKSGDIGLVGGHTYLADLIAAVPTAANAPYYARIVHEKSVLRRMIASGTHIVQLGYSEDGDADDLAERAREHLASALDGRALVTAPASPADLFLDAVKRLETPEDLSGMIETPWEDLQRLVKVFRPGQLVTIGARPGTGKSVMASDILRHVGIKLRLPVILFSLEMRTDEIMDRMLAAETGIDLSSIQNHTVNADDWNRLLRGKAKFDDATFVIDDTPGITLAQIRSRLRAMARKNPARMVIIDYLQLMRAAAGAETREREVASIMFGLKLMAREYNVPVILLAQLNRSSEARQDRKPCKADFRESGAIENDSDVVILIHREDVYERESPRAGEADLIVDKNRQGPLGTATVCFQGHYGRFTSKAWSPSAHAA